MGFWKKLFNQENPPDSARDLSRNAPCWCGSGKKYKLCHWNKDQNYFVQQSNSGVCSGGS